MVISLGYLNLCRKKSQKLRFLTTTILYLNIALSYASRDEITCAVREIASLVEKNQSYSSVMDINQTLVRKISVYCANARFRFGIAQVESSVYNFMLWQATYAELYFYRGFWPILAVDFREKAIEWFSKERRLGMSNLQCNETVIRSITVFLIIFLLVVLSLENPNYSYMLLLLQSVAFL